jgi:hypothetical protein
MHQNHPRPAITQHISPDPDSADAALQLLGIAAPNPVRADIGADRAQFLLEPWAVQTALRRRQGGQRLTDSEYDEIRRCTRDPDCLRWPRGRRMMSGDSAPDDPEKDDVGYRKPPRRRALRRVGAEMVQSA